MDLSQYPPAYLAQNNSQELINVIIAFAVLETVFLMLFVTARIINKTANGVDFWLMPVAYLACFSHVIIIALFVKYGGAGRHVVIVTPGELVVWTKLIFAEEFLYLFSALLPKLAILCLYLRIFTQKRFRYATYGIAVVMFLNWLTGCLMGLLMCKPIAYNWDKKILGGHCGDIMASYRWASLPNLITDIAMLLLPLPVIWNLHTGMSQKIGLTLTFATGSAGIVTSAVRFATFFTIDLFSDPTFLVVTSMTWTCVEPGVYFIAATLPSLRPLVHLLFKNVDFSTLFSNNAGTSHRPSSTRRPAAVKEALSDSATSAGDRSGFTKLSDADASITRANALGLGKDHDDERQKHTGRVNQIEVGYELV